MLLAAPPENIAGKIEVRGIGLVEMTHVSDVPVALVVQLFDVVDRMPPTPELRVMAGISIPVMKIAPKESRSEEHTPELQSLMSNSYAVLSLKTKKNITYQP